MQLVEVGAHAHDLLELREGVTAFSATCLVRGEIAGDDVGADLRAVLRRRIDAGDGRNGGAEVAASLEVGRRINLCGLTEVRIMAGGVVEVGRAAAGVTSIAVADCIDEEAAESDEGRILVAEVERDGSDLVADLDEGKFGVRDVGDEVLACLHADVRRGSPGCYGDDRDEYQKRTCGDPEECDEVA